MFHHRPRPFAALLALTAVLLATGCATVRRLDTTRLDTISLAELKAAPEKIVPYFRQDATGVIIAVNRGDKLPVRTTIDLGIAHLEGDAPELVFEEDLYLFLSPRGLLVSADKQKWAPIQDYGAIKEIFGLQKGSLSLGMGVTEQEGPTFSLELVAE